MKWLTKSDYIKYLTHPAYLWLAKHAKDRLPEFDEAAQAAMAQGNVIDEVARQLFPDGYLIDVPIFDSHKASAPLLSSAEHQILYQPSVLTNRSLYSKADILVRDGDLWDIYEVKSATKVRPKDLHDVAFQRLCFEEAGHKIGRCFLVHINNQYIRSGAIDPNQLFTITEITDAVDALKAETGRAATKARAIVDQAECPNLAPEFGSAWYDGWKEIYEYLHPDLPTTSIFKLTRLSMDQLKDLAKLKITDLRDIPDNFELGPQQLAQVEVAKSGEPRIHPLRIAHDLEYLKYPLYFLDYETAMSAVPLWDGTKPYQQVPFQYSLHIQDRPGGHITHKEYLAHGKVYPVPRLLEHLQADLGDTGSVIVWYKPFESSRNAEMAVTHPRYAEFLHGINERIYDLRDPFADGWYVNPDFKGSSSIKDVLPVLVPELSYKDLEIGNGTAAQSRWMKAALGELPEAEADQVYRDLVTYCGQDTFAMVRIYQELLKLSATKNPGTAQV